MYRNYVVTNINDDVVPRAVGGGNATSNLHQPPVVDIVRPFDSENKNKSN